jgi:hypothetical protein
MLSLGEQDFAATGRDRLGTSSLVTVILRQSKSRATSSVQNLSY